MGSLKQQSRLWSPVDAGPIMVPILWCIYPTRTAAVGIASPEGAKEDGDGSDLRARCVID